MATEGSRADEEMAAFVGRLSRLKAEGCSLLVVGEGPERLFARASAQMLGDAGTGRYRALAVTDAAAESVRRRLPREADSPAETATVLVYGDGVRSAASRDAGPDVRRGPAGELAATVPERRVESTDLGALRAELEDVVETFDRRADGLLPAQLRVGVDSLSPLVERHGEAELRRFVGRVGERVRDCAGMAHFVLPEPYESDLVGRLAGEFDSVVELRTTDGGGEERWHVPDEGLTMPWIPL
ncbi:MULTISPECIES: DUF7504 family protein [Halorussus]|uniref:DUF7504 family protein n=1 Tax=Halorussus TaxID=1070314 RepID=UPI00209F78B5|nr:hypothetical protein [Halorussus vallis]USZ75569.1 hypothetical protein NGM07_19335 [Halorussus vallis]